jgi:hypothetical protein
MKRPAPDVRINFQIYRDEYPLLAHELLKTRKGKPRHSRLVALAYLGIVTEKTLGAGGGENITDGRSSDAIFDPVAHKSQLSPGDLADVFGD